MIYPKFLKNGDTIAIPAPSSSAEDEIDIARYKNAKKKLENLGYEIDLSKNIYKADKGRSSSAKERGEEITNMFASNVDAIICAAGGEFLVESLSYVDFDKIAQNPKWVEGFSDPTGVLFPITTKYDIATIYGNNFGSFGMEDYHEEINNNLEILKGNIITQHSFELFENERLERVTGLEGYNLTDKVYWNTLSGHKESFKGRIIAGCFDLIMELAGTKYDGMSKFNEKYKEDGIIFGFDNCDLTKEELIRSLWKLNELGYFRYTRGIIFGRNGNDLLSYYYDNIKECLQDSVLAKLNIPIVYDADLSHKGPCMTIINGAIAEVRVKDGKGTIDFELR